jgi:hypothetical protein
MSDIVMKPLATVGVKWIDHYANESVKILELPLLGIYVKGKNTKASPTSIRLLFDLGDDFKQRHPLCSLTWCDESIQLFLFDERLNPLCRESRELFGPTSEAVSCGFLQPVGLSREPLVGADVLIGTYNRKYYLVDKTLAIRAMEDVVRIGGVGHITWNE